MKNILLIGNLTDDKFLSKTKPILKIKYINKVYLFRSKGNAYRNNRKVVVPIFPNFLLQYGGRVGRLFFDMYNFLFFFILLLFNKIDLIIGIYLYPHGFYASILGVLFNKPIILLFNKSLFRIS